MLAYNTTVHTTTGFTPYRLVFGDPGTYASWVRQALHESYDEVRAQQQRATHRQKRNYDSKAVARALALDAGPFVIIHQHRKTNYVLHGLDPTR